MTTIEHFYKYGIPKFMPLYSTAFPYINSNSENFKQLCYDVLNGININILKFDRCVVETINRVVSPYDVLIEIFDTHTKKICVNLKEHIESNTFTNKYFIKSYNDYVKSCILLAKLLSKMTKYSQTNQNNTKNNSIYVLSNYYYYTNIINYKYSNKYINSYLDLNSSVNDTIEIIKIYSFYNTFIKQFVDFKIDNNTSIILDKIDVNIINTVLDNINSDICKLKYSTNINNKETQDFIANIISVIRTFSDMSDVDFVLYYKNKLQNRLLDNCNNKVENKLLEAFSIKDNQELIATMKFLIDDIQQSETINNICKNNVQIFNITGKYDNIENYKANSTIKILSEELWKNNNINQTGNVQNFDKELNFYVDKYIALYNNIYDNTKKLDINFEKSTVKFTYEINNKKYKIISNMCQYIILTEINNNIDGIEMTHFSKHMNLTNISIEMNSLLKTKLIIKNSLNNFTINKYFNNNNDVIDLVNECEQLVKFSELRKKFNPIECKNVIYELFVTHKYIDHTIDSICEYVLNKNISAYRHEIIEYIDEFVASQVICKENEKYYINENTKNEFDSDEDEDEEDNLYVNENNMNENNVNAHNVLEEYILSDSENNE